MSGTDAYGLLLRWLLVTRIESSVFCTWTLV